MRTVTQWTDEMDAELRRGVAAREPAVDIGARLGLNKTKVLYRCTQLGLEKVRCDTWSLKDIATLRSLWAAGKTSAQIAQAIGRSKDAVQIQRRKMGLVAAKPKRPAVKMIKPDFRPAAPGDDVLRLYAATQLHLLDLKRAGHSPTRTELFVPRGYGASRAAPRGQSFSVAGSPAALCAGF